MLDRSFEPPYSALVHRWDRIQTLHQELADSDNDTRKLAVDQLVEFMQPILASSLEGLAATRATGMVNYSAVWQIFSPGEIVVTKFWGAESLCRVVKYVRDGGWDITVENVEWDGGECGFERTEVHIPKFYGLSRITSLPVYPLSFAQNPDQLKETMAARGRRFQELRGYHFLNYSGVKVSMDDHVADEPMTGRVIIDTYAYYRSNDIVKPSLRALGGSDSAAGSEAGDEPGVDANAEGSDTDGADDEGTGSEHADSEDADADAEDSSGNAETATVPQASAKRVEDLTPLSDDHCLLTSPMLIGFDLDKKKWGEHSAPCYRTQLTAQADSTSTTCATLRGTTRPLRTWCCPTATRSWPGSLSRARPSRSPPWTTLCPRRVSRRLVESRTALTEPGRGIIILMFGPPGVGKTFTAEAGRPCPT